MVALRRSGGTGRTPGWAAPHAPAHRPGSAPAASTGGAARCGARAPTRERHQVLLSIRPTLARGFGMRRKPLRRLAGGRKDRRPAARAALRDQVAGKPQGERRQPAAPRPCEVADGLESIASNPASANVAVTASGSLQRPTRGWASAAVSLISGWMRRRAPSGKPRYAATNGWRRFTVVITSVPPGRSQRCRFASGQRGRRSAPR